MDITETLPHMTAGLTKGPFMRHETGVWHEGRIPIYWRGAPLSHGAVQSLVYFSIGGADTLILDPFCQPVDFFLEGHGSRRVISFDLPFHGEGFDKMVAIRHWASRYADGEDILEPFIASVKESLDAWIAHGFLDVTNCFVAGLSRGALIAAALVAQYEEMPSLLGFAPMTQLSAVGDFKDIAKETHVSKWSIQNFYAGIYKKKVRFYIGNGDTRVSTDLCYHCIKGLADYAREHGVRSPNHEMVMVPSVGAQGHGTLPPVFRDGIAWLL